MRCHFSRVMPSVIPVDNTRQNYDSDEEGSYMSIDPESGAAPALRPRYACGTLAMRVRRQRLLAAALEAIVRLARRRAICGVRQLQSCSPATFAANAETAHVHRSIGHVLRFDSRSSRTLPTVDCTACSTGRRYIDGQHLRYVSPLALCHSRCFLCSASSRSSAMRDGSSTGGAGNMR